VSRPERISAETLARGGFFEVVAEEYRYPDGSTVRREYVRHPGSVTVIPHDSDFLYMVRQPREAVGEEALLELPAGKLDVPGESPLECARRELGEEIGMGATEWRELKRFYTSPGCLSEESVLFLATGLHPVEAKPTPGERIEVVRWPLEDLEGAIDSCADAASLIGLLVLRDLDQDA
jgi:ADP-ribose pyrophosphatase